MAYLSRHRMLTIVSFDEFIHTLSAGDEHYALSHLLQEVFVVRYSASLSMSQITSMVSVLSGVSFEEEHVRPLLSRLVRERVLRSRICPDRNVILWEVNY